MLHQVQFLHPCSVEGGIWGRRDLHVYVIEIQGRRRSQACCAVINDMAAMLPPPDASSTRGFPRHTSEQG